MKVYNNNVLYISYTVLYTFKPIFTNDTIRIELREGYDKEFLRSIIEVLINDTKIIK